MKRSRFTEEQIIGVLKEHELGAKTADLGRRVEETLALAALSDKADRLVGELAHGDQRAAELAMALALKPRLLLLDEPTAGMGDQETYEITQLVRRLHKDGKLTIVLIEHDMRVVFHLAERIMVLDQGKLLAEGTPQEIAANKAKIAANSARFGELDQYYILDEVTVLFGNGVVKVDPKYNDPLLALVKKAMEYNGYNIQVKGYASSVGSAALNQQLSEERANNVTNIIVQQGHVPLTNMLAPGAMGESRQVGNDKTAEGQAENRRVVVRALLNKGIAGTELPLPSTK